MNLIYDNKLKIKYNGNSHSKHMVLEVKNLPRNFKIDFEIIKKDLARRRPTKQYETKRIENDTFAIFGLDKNNYTKKGKIKIIVYNNNFNKNDYLNYLDIPRPGHIDFISLLKYNQIFSGSGIFSGRMTVLLVVLGSICKQILNLEYESKVIQVGHETDSEKFDYVLEKIRSEKDSIGGKVRVVLKNPPKLVGSPIFNKLTSQISYFSFIIPGLKEISFSEDEKYLLPGSLYNDKFIDNFGNTNKNDQAGLSGGIANGNPIIIEYGFRPPSSIFKTQNSFSLKENKVVDFNIVGRHDSCYLFRTPVILESAISIAIMETYLNEHN